MNEAQRRLLDIVRFTQPLGGFAEPGRQVLGIENYAYSIDYQVAVGGPGRLDQTPLVQNLIMDSDSDFVMTYISGGALCNAFDPAFTNQRRVQWNPSIQLQITNRATSMTFFDQPVLLPLVAGMNGFPFLMASPRIIKPRSTLQIAASNAFVGNSSQFYGFFLTLHGAKIYYR